MPEADPTTPVAPTAVWTTIRSDADLRFVNLRRPGVDQLLIYAGRTRNGADELSEAGATLRAGGFDLITHAPATPAQTTNQSAIEGEQSPTAGASAVSDARLREFLELALSRPGYRRRVLVLHGRHLAVGLPLLTAAPRSVSLTIVLRPGEALPEAGRLLQAIQHPGMDRPLRLLWAAGPETTEALAAGRLRRLLERAVQRYPLSGTPESKRLSLETLRLPGLSAAGRRSQPFRLQLTEHLEFELLLLRAEPRWRPLLASFPQGCAYNADGPGFRTARSMQVSGPRDADFCPLFLRWPGRPLFRAEAVTANSCVYRVADGRTRLHCDTSGEAPRTN